MKSQLAALAVLSSSISILAAAQDTGAPPPVEPGEVDHWAPWYWTGAQSVYWVRTLSLRTPPRPPSALSILQSVACPLFCFTR
jgi:hypothetical protein